MHMDTMLSYLCPETNGTLLIWLICEQIKCCCPLRSHISTSCEDNQVYLHAISDARCVFDMGVSHFFQAAICNEKSLELVFYFVH